MTRQTGREAARDARWRPVPGEGNPDVWGRALDDRVTVTMPEPLGNASVSGRGVPGAPAVRRGIIGS